LSRFVDNDTHSKRLYAAAHAPLAPPTTPVADLLCHERDILSSSSDSDYPPASQRENCPPWLGTQSRPPSPQSATSSERSGTARSLYQLTRLATQLVTTVQDQLKCTRDDAQRIVNEHAEREHRLLQDAASMRDALLAHDQQAREIEAERERRLLDDVQQRERDLRRDMYDLAAQRSRAAALEAELKCLKANTATPTVAYEVIEVPVQPDDIAPPEVTTAVQMSPLRPVTPIDNLAVQGLPPNITQRQDIADALTWNPDASTDNCHGAGILTSQPPYLSSATNEPTVCRTGLPYTQPQPSDPGSHHESDTLPRQLVTRATVFDPVHAPVHTFPRELPQPSAPSDPGYTHQSDTFSRRPVTAVSDPGHAFPRLLTQPACTQSTMTSMLPCQPAYMPTRSPILVGPPPSDDVLTSALPRPLTVPGDLPSVDTAMQRPVDRVDNRNVYTHSVEQWLPQLPPPPHVCKQQSVPLLSDRTQTTASDYVNTNSVPSLSPHRYAANYQNISANLSLPSVEFYLYPTVGTVLIHSVKPELTE